MNKNKKIIIGILITVLIVIGVIVAYKVIEKSVTDRADFNYTIDNISSTPVDTINNTEKESEGITMDNIYIKVNNEILTVQLEENSSSKAFIEKLKDRDITISASDYGNFEKVGELGFNLPTNDTKITTTSGDLILYQGNKITLYYDTNTWSFTKLGKVQNKTQEELKNILGVGDVKLTFSISN